MPDLRAVKLVGYNDLQLCETQITTRCRPVVEGGYQRGRYDDAHDSLADRRSSIWHREGDASRPNGHTRRYSRRLSHSLLPTAPDGSQGVHCSPTAASSKLTRPLKRAQLTQPI